MDLFNKFSAEVKAKLPEYTTKAGKTFTLYKQQATEKFGSGAHVTELPQDYLALEKRYLALLRAHQQLVRIAKSYAGGTRGLNMEQIQTQALTYTRQATEQLTRLIGPGKGAQPGDAKRGDGDTPRTLHHAMARECLATSESVDLEQPLGAGMFKFGCLEEKVGDAELERNEEIHSGFIAPMSQVLEGEVRAIEESRKQVQAARLMLDAAKAAQKGARPDKVGEATNEVERAEDHYVTIVEKTMTLMRELLESPELLKGLSSLVAAQIRFHQKALEHLNDLAPELDEIQATQEALYKH